MTLDGYPSRVVSFPETDSGCHPAGIGFFIFCAGLVSRRLLHSMATDKLAPIYGMRLRWTAGSRRFVRLFLDSQQRRAKHDGTLPTR